MLLKRRASPVLPRAWLERTRPITRQNVIELLLLFGGAKGSRTPDLLNAIYMGLQ